ncbi:MAG TPA: prolyl oligopeptidase family serine peptidase [Tenuifilaceae bacterium]|nr:prolyl oligopeptidase family serine peptidase [Tenuifilaceae bacterium]
MKRIVLLCILSLTFFALSAQELLVDKWLAAGSIEVLEPALSQKENTQGELFKTSELLKSSLFNLETFSPKNGEAIKGTNLIWNEQTVDADSMLRFSFNEKGNRIAFFSTYVSTEYFWKGMLSINSSAPFELFVINSKLADRYTASSESKPISKEVKLVPGKHRILVKVLLPDTLTNPSTLKVCFKPSEDYVAETLVVSTNPIAPLTINQLLEGPKLSSAAISAAGDFVLVTISELNTEKEKNSWFRKVVRLSDGKTLSSFRQSEVSSVQWMPKGNKLSYIAGGSLWVFDFDKLNEARILDEAKEVSGYTWAPNEQFIIYSIDDKDDSKKGDVKRILTMEDRQPGWRERSFLYKTEISSGKTERLTWGNQSTWLQDISPDSKKIIFTVSHLDYSERPYDKHTLIEMNLATHKIDTIFANKLFAMGASYSPDGKKLLITSAPLAFGDLGVNVSDGKLPNGYDTQAYIYEMESKKVRAITKNFNPSISSSWWCPTTNNIYFNTDDEDRNNVYLFNTKSEKFTQLKLAEEVINRIDFAKTKQLAVYTGNGMNSWKKAYLVDLKTNKSSLIEDPEKDTYKQVALGETKEWNFKSSLGKTIKGRYYLPPNFDASKKYPTIVYYYGGTSPVGRDFGGRYPKELYAAHGFVVYVLQPSGATGFGQDFSAAHVNAWGKVTADEIIEGTKKFSAEHSFVDASSIGCIGASYGGFMTQYLLTQTDIFAAAISHAGISALTSYWGEGYWGYAYSAEASANSFPWNNKDLYVNQSPLFSADKITTPLLLLHGSADTNVPVGESIQMFTALKLLGKPVELIQFDEENHFIMKYSRRVQWTNSILAWFSMHLKNEKGWWEELYPDKNF